MSKRKLLPNKPKPKRKPKPPKQRAYLTDAELRVFEEAARLKIERELDAAYDPKPSPWQRLKAWIGW